jgi:selenocysteine lyase/cysteine desulfurase
VSAATGASTAAGTQTSPVGRASEALACLRHEFSLPATGHYLNCAYMSPLPRRVEAAGLEGLIRKRAPNEIGPRDFFEDADRARSLFGELIGARDPRRVTIVPAASYAIAIAARNSPCAAGQTIVVSGEQFPSNVHAWRRLAARTGARVNTVVAPDSTSRGQDWNAAIIDAIDETTAIVALPQVHWTDGTRFDLERIGHEARRVGAAFIIDATQSIGALPFDVEAVGPDLVVAAAYKWLLGPYGIGAAWIGPRFENAEPLEETWIGRAASDDFQGLVNYRDDYQPGSARFDVGERSNFILTPMLVAALRLVLELRPDRIQEYCRALVCRAIDEARDLGFGVEHENWRASHLFGLRTPAGVDLKALQNALQAAGVSASLRGSALRLSPHVYNDAADVAALMGVLRHTVG